MFVPTRQSWSILTVNKLCNASMICFLLMNRKEIGIDWSMWSWWLFIKTEVCPDPVIVKWVPAHVADSVPDSLITQELAAQHGTTVLSILRNYHVAKLAAAASPIHFGWMGWSSSGSESSSTRFGWLHQALSDWVLEQDPVPCLAPCGGDSTCQGNRVDP